MRSGKALLMFATVSVCVYVCLSVTRTVASKKFTLGQTCVNASIFYLEEYYMMRERNECMARCTEVAGCVSVTYRSDFVQCRLYGQLLSSLQPGCNPFDIVNYAEITE